MIWHGKFRSLTSFPFKCCTYVISLYLHNLRINLWILKIHEVADIFDIVFLTLAWSSLWTCLVEDPPLYFILPYQKLWTLPRVVLQELFMLGKNILKSYLPLVGWLRNSPGPLSRVLDEGQRRSTSGFRDQVRSQQNCTVLIRTISPFQQFIYHQPSVCQPSKIMTHIQDLFLIHLPLSIKN